MAVANDLSTQKTKTAKLNREIFKAIGNGTLNISISSIHFMAYVAKYIDGMDGRIYVDLEQVRKDLCMQVRTLKRTISELTNHGLLSFRDGFYYSSFHVHTNGGETYQKLLNVYTSPEVLNLSKNQLRLFYYIATMGMVGTWKSIYVENLYKNNLHDTRYGIQYFDSYRNFADALFELIEKGLVSVWLVNENKFIDHKTPEYKELFHAYCETNNEGRKVRTSDKRRHKIALKINDAIAEDVSNNCANEAEFDYFADQFHIVYQFIKTETKRYFINLKNRLTEILGTTGLEIYRSALIAYFKNNEELVLYHDMNDKAANYFKDFYLLEEIKKILIGVLASLCGNSGAMAATVDYPVNKGVIGNLIKFFRSEASKNHLISFDAELEDIEINWIKVLNKERNQWIDLYMEIEKIYNRQVELTKADIRELAKEGLLHQKEKLDELIKTQKKKIRFLPINKKEDAATKSARKILFDENGNLYNWLES